MELNTVERDSSATCGEAAFWLHPLPMCSKAWLQHSSSPSKQTEHWLKIQEYFLHHSYPHSTSYANLVVFQKE